MIGTNTEIAASRAFIIGSTGFLGQALVRRLSADGWQCVCLVRSEAKAESIADLDGVEIVYGDVVDYERLCEQMAGVDVVFHVAAAMEGRYEQQLHVNVGGTGNVALAALENGVRRMVHVSSIAVYGYRVRGQISEDTPHNPGSVAYNRTKSQGEGALKAALDGMMSTEYVIVRPALIYGPGSSMWTRNLFRLARTKPTPFIGDGGCPTFPIYIDDVVDMLVTCATHPDAAGQAFNCAPSPAPDWRTFLGEYQRLAGHDAWLGVPVTLARILAPLLDVIPNLRGVPVDVRGLVHFVSVPHEYDMSRAKNVLGWEPSVSLTEGVNRCKPYLQLEGLLS